jgi:glucosylceramidase
MSAAERRAITIASVNLTGDDSLGAFVSVTFRGDVERYLGQGHLSSGLLALALVPEGGQPVGLVDEGAGRSERVLRFTSARPAGVIRHGDQVTFFLAGVRLSRFARVDLKVLAASSGRSTWRQILAARPADQASLTVDSGALTCSQLTAIARGLAALGGGPEVNAQEQALQTVRAAVGRAQLAACAPPAPAPQPTTTTTGAGTGTATATATTTTTTTTTTSPPPAGPEAVSVVQTDAGLSQKLASQPGLAFSNALPSGVPVIAVNDQLAYQRFGGLGAAITDSAAWLIYEKLSASDRATLMQELFGASGIHLNFLRIAMGASGAMTVGAPFSYDDQLPGRSDPTLTDFALQPPDLDYVIPTLQQALSINPSLEILANPWSPPGWMKGNDSLGNQNDSGTLIASDYQPLADYFVKVIQDYAAAGVPIEAITPQNEPRTPPGSGTSYPGLTLPASQEVEFITNHLAPALSAAGLHTKIYGSDLSWDQTAYANALTTGAAGNLAGIAWHCYFGSPTVMTQLEQSTPGLDQIVDECSPEIRGFGAPEFLISTLRNWASVVSVWTAATDPNGQPIQPGNNCTGCRGLVTIDQNAQTATLRTEYYQLGQVSSFVQPGAHRIDSPNFVTYGLNGSNIETVSAGLDDVAFLNPDGTKVLVTNNNSNAPISFAVQSDGRYFTYTIPAQAMTTFAWR